MRAVHAQAGAVAVVLAIAVPSAAAEGCQSLAGKTLGHGTATVTDASIVAATGAEPEYCVAHVKFNDSALRFEARLPTSGWNDKLAMLGGGGFTGSFFTPSTSLFSGSITAERYATVATNGGYDWSGPRDAKYFRADFAYDPAKLADFTFLSEHRSAPLAKELVQSFYGTAPRKSYYEGCSMGGRQALLLAQRYPQDFDGIVARAPAGNLTGLFMQFNRVSKLVRSPAHRLGPAKQDLVADAVLAKCDGLDGIADGIISKPLACTFDPSLLRCPAGGDTGDSCLSDAQLETVNTVTSPISTSNGAWSHAGFPFGGENSAKGWGEYIWPSRAFGDSLQGLFSDGFVRSFVTRNPDFDTSTWSPDEWLASLSLVSNMQNATAADLSAASSRGMKIIMWNGTTDTSVSPRETARYYARIVEAIGQAQADNVAELFLAPGVGHCGGGAGPDKVDLMKAVSAWVEQGVSPSRQGLVHRKVDAKGATTMSRPACKYPAYPRYGGSGDPNDAANFSCSMQ